MNEPGAHGLGRGEGAVLDGLHARGTVADEHHAVKAQQDGTAARVTREFVLDAVQRVLDEQRGDLALEGPRSVAFISPRSSLAAPSVALSATLPVKPSQTTTSTLPEVRSPPSQLPANPGTRSAMSG